MGLFRRKEQTSSVTYDPGTQKANLTYDRDKNGFEVDIITDWKKNFAIEVKSKSDVEKNYLQA